MQRICKLLTEWTFSLRLSQIALLLALAIAANAFAQENKGTITGVVKDASGAVVAGAKVEARNDGTHATFDSVTNDVGIYTIPLLPAGTYTLTVTRNSFETSVVRDIDVRVSDRIQRDFSLAVGAVTQEVVVTSSTQELDTATASRYAVVDTQEIQDLPLEGRTTTLFSTLETGVQYTNYQPSSSARPFDNGLIENVVVNGGRQARNDYLLNGISNTFQELASSYANVGLEPPPDAVSEVKVHTSEYDAQFGHTSGGVVNVNTKSGTNTFHGSAYWFARNNILNANSFQNNANHVVRPEFKWNQPGLEVDGPVRIPHLYNGRDRTFFMFSWERIKDFIPGATTYTVPTDAERAGDFSHTTVNGSPITLYNPLNVVGGVRQPFLNNNIANYINPVAAALAKYWPEPTPGAGDSNGNNNFIASPNGQSDLYDVFTYQVDQTISASKHLTATYGHSDRHQTTAAQGIPLVASSGYYLIRINYVGGLAYSWILNPTTVLSLRYGFMRHELAVNSFSGLFGKSGLTGAGFPSSLVNSLQYPTFPNLSFTGSGHIYETIGGSLGLFAGQQLNYSTNNAFSAALTKTVNRHSLTLGMEYDIVLNNRHSLSSPYFAFSPVFTQQSPSTASATQGDGFADFLLGYPGEPTGTPGATLAGSFPFVVSPALKNVYVAGYAQDDWRINSRLTLNLGLRWDIETPPTDRFNRLNAGFNPTAPVTNFPVTGLQGGLLFASSSNREPFADNFTDWQPRLGAAYTINDKTVARIGYARFFLPAFGDQGYTQGFSSVNPYDQSDNGNSTPANSLSNPYPNGLTPPTGATLGTGTALGTAINYSSNYRPLPHVDSYSLGVQRQLGKGWVVDVSYVGSKTHSLEVSTNIDSLSLANLALGASVLNATVANPFAGLLPGTSLNGATTTKQQLLLPFPQFTGVTANNLPYGHTWYNSLQARVEHRFASGFFFQSNITVSKNMEAVAYLNPQNYFNSPGQLMHVVTADDALYRWRINGGYSIPGIHTRNEVVKDIFNGWKLNSIVTIQSGTPVAAPTGATSTGLNPKLGHPLQTKTQYFNNCYITLTGANSSQCSTGISPAWVQEPAFTLNNFPTRMSSVRTQLPTVSDTSIFKSWPIYERLQLEFRAEAFNLTNTPYFAPGTGSVTSATFGQDLPAQANDPRAIQLSLRAQF